MRIEILIFFVIKQAIRPKDNKNLLFKINKIGFLQKNMLNVFIKFYLKIYHLEKTIAINKKILLKLFFLYENNFQLFWH